MDGRKSIDQKRVITILCNSKINNYKSTIQFLTKKMLGEWMGEKAIVRTGGCKFVSNDSFIGAARNKKITLCSKIRV